MCCPDLEVKCTGRRNTACHSRKLLQTCCGKEKKRLTQFIESTCFDLVPVSKRFLVSFSLAPISNNEECGRIARCMFSYVHYFTVCSAFGTEQFIHIYTFETLANHCKTKWIILEVTDKEARHTFLCGGVG